MEQVSEYWSKELGQDVAILHIDEEYVAEIDGTFFTSKPQLEEIVQMLSFYSVLKGQIE